MALNIDMDDNALDFELVKSVSEFFHLSEEEMNAILEEVISVVKDWKTVANQIGIPIKEQIFMESAFNTES